MSLGPGQTVPAGIEALRLAIQRQPDRPDLHNELGIALGRGGQLAAAEQCFLHALRLRTDYATAYHNLAGVYRLSGRLPEAELAYLRAVAYQPQDGGNFLALAQFLRSLRRFGEAINCYRQAVAISPTLSEGWLQLGSLLCDLGRTAEGIAALESAVRTGSGQPHPIQAEIELRIGIAYRSIQRAEQAEAAYRRAIAAHPQLSAAHANLAHLLADQGLFEQARAEYDLALADPGLPAEERFRIQLAQATVLPIVYPRSEELTPEREQLVQRLQRLGQSPQQIDTTRHTIPNLFYLAYQGQNDRDLHRLISRCGRQSDLRRNRLRSVPTQGRIKVGICSSFLCDHTIGRLNIGWIERLPKDEFELHLFASDRSKPDDPLARRYRQAAARFYDCPRELTGILDLLAAQGLDILVHLDVGMDPLSSTLAWSRVAPVQAVTWGHPVTTGLATIDDFLSADTAEPDDAAAHYTEQLIRFPHLGCWYERPAVPESLCRRSDLGLPEVCPIYSCPQTLFKLHPVLDDVFRGILEQDSRGIIVLLNGRYPQWTALLKARLSRTLGPHQDRIRFLPALPRDKYLALLRVSDVVLDPLHFSGGNSSYEALAMGTPVVTCPGGFLRSRLTLAMYRQMNYTELVCDTPSDLVGRACRLVADPEYATQVRQQIAARSAVLFEDQTAVDAWADYFRRCRGRVAT